MDFGPNNFLRVLLSLWLNSARSLLPTTYGKKTTKKSVFIRGNPWQFLGSGIWDIGFSKTT
jgi:hypothetical protein